MSLLGCRRTHWEILQRKSWCRHIRRRALELNELSLSARWSRLEKSQSDLDSHASRVDLGMLEYLWSITTFLLSKCKTSKNQIKSHELYWYVHCFPINCSQTNRFFCLSTKVDDLENVNRRSCFSFMRENTTRLSRVLLLPGLISGISLLAGWVV